MRVPRRLNKRLQTKVLKHFGVYEKVAPIETTPSRKVPDYIEKPNYIMGKALIIPAAPEIKDLNQLRGMKRSCKLASTILGQVQKVIKVYFKGFHGDCSKTFFVGDVDDRGYELVAVTEECLHMAIKSCGPNVPFAEIGSTIQRHATQNRLTVLPAFLGHGIGEYFHGPPDIYHTINDYPGTMKPGMTFTIEPVLSHGSEDTVMLEDGWTVVTDDGSRAAQAEHTVLITENGAEILTK